VVRKSVNAVLNEWLICSPQHKSGLMKAAGLADDVRHTWRQLDLPTQQAIVGTVAGGGLGVLSPLLLGTKPKGWRKYAPVLLGGGLGGYGGYQLGRIGERIGASPLAKSVLGLATGAGIDPALQVQLSKTTKELTNRIVEQGATKLIEPIERSRQDLLQALLLAILVPAAQRASRGTGAPAAPVAPSGVSAPSAPAGPPSWRGLGANYTGSLIRGLLGGGEG
jgi:hypothetical protein